MKTIIQRAEERGKGEFGWLHARYSFSFARWYDPGKMNFGLLRVLNDDIIDPGQGFGTHPHDNMEIVTIILDGELEHRDSMGNGAIIRKNEVQAMSAGTGVEHSEFNPSKINKTNLLQLWIFPKEEDIKPRYEQKSFPPEKRKNKIKKVVSGNREEGTIYIHQNAAVSLGNLSNGEIINYNFNYKSNGAYLFVIDGNLSIGKENLFSRDAIGITDSDVFEIRANEESNFIIVEVPMEL